MAVGQPGDADRAMPRPHAMRQRVIVGTKLVETISRGLFVLLCTYRLPVVDAGQFGLAATLIGMLAFLLGYERQIDLQRQVAGRSVAAIRQRMSDTLRFFAAHYSWTLPLMAILLWQGFGWSTNIVGLVIVISVAEHLSNQAYQAALVSGRNYPLQALVTAKSCLLLLGVLVLALNSPLRFTANSVLWVWTLVSLLFIALAIWIWIVWLRLPSGGFAHEERRQGVPEQYRASRLHFMVGVVAVTALQADRIVVGGMLSAHDIGIYFRNIMLTALALQLFNIVSFNRAAPAVYALVREGHVTKARRMVHKEYRLFALATLAAYTIALAINLLAGNPAARFGVDFGFLAILTLGMLFRCAADYAGLILLSTGADTTVFRNQFIAVLLGVSALLALAWQFGLLGAVACALSAPFVYFMMNWLAVRHRV